MGLQAPKVVVFDLYNTLIPGGSRSQRDEVSGRMADALGVDGSDFAAVVRLTFDDRVRGRLGDLEHTLWALAQRLGASPSAPALEQAAQLRLQLTRSLHQQTWALPALTQLRRAGVPCALVTDCSAETPAVWGTSPLRPFMAATSFSCLTGHRKPEPQSYLRVLDRFAADPAACLYVGDGGSDELTGAQALGMSVIRYVGQHDLMGEQIDPDDGWVGPSITDLTALPLLLAAS